MALDVISTARVQIDGAIADETRRQRPLCVASGCCCRFEAFGHRLYVTLLEARGVVDRLRRELGRDLDEATIDSAIVRGACPFLVDRTCSVHAIRPFACRTFFCDPEAELWQQELHERMHAQVRALHDEIGEPYRYGEWREMLRMVVQEGRADSSAPAGHG